MGVQEDIQGTPTQMGPEFGFAGWGVQSSDSTLPSPHYVLGPWRLFPQAHGGSSRSPSFPSPSPLEPTNLFSVSVHLVYFVYLFCFQTPRISGALRPSPDLSLSAVTLLCWGSRRPAFCSTVIFQLCPTYRSSTLSGLRVYLSDEFQHSFK